jgi:O-acetylhomoserine/O-acetylserine sulfhydrylase-like pyridoxal-dependent enzyme
MSENDLKRSFTAQGDSGVVYTIVSTPSEDDAGKRVHALRDGTPVVETEDGLFRIEATGEILTPRG